MLSTRPLTLYRASAGAGKTYTLVREFLRLALAEPDAWRRILAVTFTNKATGELKRRLLEQLHALADPTLPISPDYLEALLQPRLPNEAAIRAAAAKLMGQVLHNYHHLSVQTLDTFFSRVVRAFILELNRKLRREERIEFSAELDLDTDSALAWATTAMLADVGRDEDLTRWLLQFIDDRLAEDKSWDVQGAIRQLGRTLFSDEFLSRFPDGLPQLADADAIAARLKAFRAAYRKQVLDLATPLWQMVQDAGFSADDFTQKGRGPAGHLQKIVQGGLPDPNSYTRAILDTESKWLGTKHPRLGALQDLLDMGLHNGMAELLTYQLTEGATFVAAAAVLKRLHVYPLLGRLQAQLSTYRADNHVLLISDIPNLLASIVDQTAVPFIYEKVGTRYQHYLLDEFQDTSRRQWQNLKPLVENAMASGHGSLVVGDEKQSIYRWRGGHMELLAGLKSDFPEQVQEAQLARNYRSGGHIVSFNNQFFERASQVLLAEMAPGIASRLADAYAPQALHQSAKDALQWVGFIHLELLPKKSATEADDDDLGWKQLAAQKTVLEIRHLLAQGFRYKDIALLVRVRSEGEELAAVLTEAGIPVLSPESLKVTSSAKVQLLVSALAYLVDTRDTIARTHLAWCWAQQRGLPVQDPHSVFAPAEDAANPGRDSQLPPAFLANAALWRRLPIYELVEQLIACFNLSTPADPFVQRFMDLVLSFSQRRGGGIQGFAEFWEREGPKTALPGAIAADAVQILTIHKAKGLEFPVVILPFCKWDLTPNARHPDILWAKPETDPFAHKTQLPIDSISNLDKTDPASPLYQTYLEEYWNAYLDNLNLLYVAFTRPIERLYIFSVSDEKAGTAFPRHVHQLLYQVAGSLGGQQAVPDGAITWGNAAPKLPEPAKTGSRHRTLTLPSASTWSQTLTLRRQANALDRILNPTAELPTAWGQLVHLALEQVRTAADVPHALAQLQFQGLASAAQLPRLQSLLDAVVTHPALVPFFTWQGRVLTEASILVPASTPQRPDRILLSANQTIILDFKTGLPHPSHRAQLSAYKDLLSQMGLPGIEGHLVYLEPLTLVTV